MIIQRIFFIGIVNSHHTHKWALQAWMDLVILWLDIWTINIWCSFLFFGKSATNPNIVYHKYMLFSFAVYCLMIISVYVSSELFAIILKTYSILFWCATQYCTWFREYHTNTNKDTKHMLIFKQVLCTFQVLSSISTCIELFPYIKLSNR